MQVPTAGVSGVVHVHRCFEWFYSFVVRFRSFFRFFESTTRFICCAGRVNLVSILLLPHRYRYGRDRRHGLSNRDLNEYRACFKACVCVEAYIHDAQCEQASDVAGTMSGYAATFYRLGNDRYVNDLAALESDGRGVAFIGRQITMARFKYVFRLRQGTTRAFGWIFTCRPNVPKNSTNCGSGALYFRGSLLVVGSNQGRGVIALCVSAPARAVVSTVKLFRCLFRRGVQVAALFRLPWIWLCLYRFEDRLRVIRVRRFRLPIPICRYCLFVFRVCCLVDVFCGEDNVQDRRGLVFAGTRRRQATFAHYGGFVKVVLLRCNGDVHAGRLARYRLCNYRRVRIVDRFRVFCWLCRCLNVDATFRYVTFNLRFFFRGNMIFSSAIVSRDRDFKEKVVEVNVG